MKKTAGFLVIVFCSLACGIFDTSPEWRALKTINETPEMQNARKNLDLSVQETKGKTSDSLLLNVKVKNSSTSGVKDLEVVCHIYAASGTEIQIIKKTVYQNVNANSEKNFPEVNFGRINSQTNSFSCLLGDFAVMQ